MNCSHMITHIVRSGDSLYQIANEYHTEVADILSQNPGVFPRNLQVGMQLVICPGEDYNQREQTTIPSDSIAAGQRIELINSMRLVWSQHVYWTRMLMISIIEKLNDQEEVTNRLLQNPSDIAGIFDTYYQPDITRTIEQLLTEHLQIGAELITVLRDGNMEEADILDQQWYANADQIADALGNSNPYYDAEELRNMLYTHLELTKQEVAMRIAGDYQADITAFDEVEQEVLSMADYLSYGLMEQFP